MTNKDAVISACGTWRYRLSRVWGSEPLLPFIMLNPSTADADLDDPTIRRCVSFAKREGNGGIIVVNLFSLRSTNPAQLRDVKDPYGPDTLTHVRFIADEARREEVPMVCAWGTHGSLYGRDEQIKMEIMRVGTRLVCLGKTKEGHPRHPLYVRSDQVLEPYD